MKSHGSNTDLALEKEVEFIFISDRQLGVGEMKGTQKNIAF
jgi:hypothetical protein